MASVARSCAVCSLDEVAPTDTLRVVRLQRLRIRRAAAGCLEPIPEEDGDSDVDGAGSLEGSRSAYSSRGFSAAVDRSVRNRDYTGLLSVCL